MTSSRGSQCFAKIKIWASKQLYGKLPKSSHMTLYCVLVSSHYYCIVMRNKDYSQSMVYSVLYTVCGILCILQGVHKECNTELHIA